ncbi:MAG: hypothetical protein WC850_06085 [Candidatus Gracilibacteria bacterium]
MIKKIFLIFIFFTTLFLGGIADAYFCDGYNEGDNLCSSGNTIESIDNLQNFNSSYQSNIFGYFGSKFIDTFSQNLESEFLGYIGNKYNYTISPELWSSIGFLGTKRDSKTPINSIAPLGFMKNFDSNTLVYDNQALENNFLDYPLIKYISENSSDSVPTLGASSDLNACSVPQNASNIKIEIKNNGLLDYINLSWQNQSKEKIKIIKISPEYKEYLVANGIDNFEDFSLNPGTNYSYFIVVYNNCYNYGFYSDVVTVNYQGKKKEGGLFLSLLNNELVLNIPDTLTVGSKIRLKCNDNLNTIINDFLIDGKYIINASLLKKYFTCESSFFDKNGIFQKSELFINKPFVDFYIREKQALDFIYTGDSSNLLFNDLYLNVSSLENEAYLTYSKASLYLSNIIFGTYISDENISFDIFNELGLFKTGVSKTDRINEKDFIDLFLYTEKNLVNLKNNFLVLLDKYYGNKKYNFVLKEIDKVFLINKYLKDYKSIDKKKFDNLYNCVSHINCDDTHTLKTLLSELYYSSKGNQEKDIVNYKDYIKLLYFETGYTTYVKKGYSLDEYNKFIDILTESITYGNSFYDKNISYNSFQNLQYEVIFYDKLGENISYLTDKYLEKINAIYISSKKEDLIEILREFLSRE